MGINNEHKINGVSQMPKYVDNGECSRVVSFEQNQQGQEEIVIWGSETKQTRILNEGSKESTQKLFDAVPSCPSIEFVPRDTKDEKPLEQLFNTYYLNNQ